MKEGHEVLRPHEPFEANLSTADDRIRLSTWLPPQAGTVPRIRWGNRWINVLWAVPLAMALLILGIAIAQQLRTMPGVQEFLVRYPGITPSSRAVYSGFPLWCSTTMMRLLGNCSRSFQ